MAEASGSSGGEFLDRSQWERENAFLEKAFLETGCYLGEQETINRNLNLVLLKVQLWLCDCIY